ncbi:MAG: hypothetical protein E7616_04985 [Ruminococcaceae bacterium]|nr:hypothetical protein [Oscillospiraceae bacterium]
MDNYLMIERLKESGVRFDSGLSDIEIKKIESTYGFRFPKEIASFLSCAYPVGGGFFDYRDISQKNVDRFYNFQKNIIESFDFDIKNNTGSLQAMLKKLLGEFSDTEDFKKAVMKSLENSPKLIPFYAHRCFFDGIDNMPIISFGQAVDTIIYGYDLENYFESEFLVKVNDVKTEEIYDDIAEKLKATGIWYYIIGSY